VQSIQLYIEGQRVDMFKDESVNITQSIKNVKDVAKIFTEFTKTFTLPASKTNNKIFKHYYNFDIIGGFDARTKKDATLELNYLPFKKGKIKLEGVDLQNRKPKSYRITFFGNTVGLKDILGDDQLSSLTFTKYNVPYASTDIERNLQRSPLTNSTGTVDTIGTLSITDGSGFGVISVGDLITNTFTNETTYITSYPISSAIVLNEQIFTSVGQGYQINNHILTPLITHTQPLFFNSNTSDETADDGNLKYFSGGGSHDHGVKFNQLKYAIRVNEIIRAIESDYESISFTSDFFKNTSKKEFDNLYLWLHRKSGAVENLGGTTSTTTLVSGWNNINNGEFRMLNNNTFRTLVYSSDPFLTQLRVSLFTTDTDSYDIRLERDGNTVYTKTGQVGSIGLNGDDDSDFVGDAGDYKLYITSTSSISFTNVRWSAIYYEPLEDPLEVDYDTGAFETTSEFIFNVALQTPEIKIIDFLTGLFKMFNLVAFVEDGGTIYIDTLDNFYANKKSISTAYDISEFVDVNSSQVNVALPFKEIQLKYKDTKTFLANKFTQLANRDWASTTYKAGENELSGSEYKIEVPFSHFQYERLNDVNGGTQKDIQWGYSVNESQEAYKGAPLLFYPIRQNTGGISFVNFVDPNGVADDHKQLTNIVLPSNSVTLSSASDTSNINFNNETNEWSLDTTFTNTLFQEYHSNYITNVFDTKNRLTKVKAYLPLKILLNFTLADRFDINGKRYKINSIDTNLATGESNIELLNEL
jgi:hypothetical protein